MRHDFVAPTLCFSSHCDCYGGMPAPSPPGGVAGSDTPGSPLQDLSAAVPVARASRRDPLFCAAQAAFCLHGLGSLSLCLFLPCHPCTGLSTLPLPPFLHPPVSPGASRACKCVHSVALRVRVPPPRPACSPSVPARPPPGPGSTAPSSLSRADVVTCTEFSVMVLSLGGRAHSVPRLARR